MKILSEKAALATGTSFSESATDLNLDLVKTGSALDPDFGPATEPPPPLLDLT